MRKSIEIYCNYGVLGAEKRNIYTYGEQHSRATCSDRMTVFIPDDWDVFQNDAHQTIVEAPWGWFYPINEVLQGNKKPCFYAMDKDMKGHRCYLEMVESE